MNLYAFAAAPISAGFRNRLHLFVYSKKRGNLSSEILFFHERQTGLEPATLSLGS